MGVGGTGLSHEESTGLGPKAGLTSRQGQQAQVVETLVTIELPLLKQEIHHLSRGAKHIQVLCQGEQLHRDALWLLPKTQREKENEHFLSNCYVLATG